MTKQDLIDFETVVKGYWESGEIKAPVHLCGGNEDDLIEIFKEIKPNDYVFSTHRNHYHALLHGVHPSCLLKEILGTSTDGCGGRARSMGYIEHSKRFYASAIVGGCCAIAVGVAVALKYQEKHDPLNKDEHASRRHVWCFVGDGAVDGGHFWEALTYSEGHQLPITFVVEDNNRATCTSVMDRMGIGKSSLRNTIELSSKVHYYRYDFTYPHVGSGKYVQF